MEKKSTIVRYSDDLTPENAYPRKIVSPVVGGPCCLLHSRETGKVRREGMWRYIYVRCQICGYTVRRIVGRAAQRRLGARQGRKRLSPWVGPRRRRPLKSEGKR